MREHLRLAMPIIRAAKAPSIFLAACEHHHVHLVLLLPQVHEHFCVLVLQLNMLGSQRAAALLQEAVAFG